MLGKIAMVMIFMIRENPGALQTLAIYPVLIVLYLQCTYSRRDRNIEGSSIGTLFLFSCVLKVSQVDISGPRFYHC